MLRRILPAVFVGVLVLLAACDPLAPMPTAPAPVIIVTAVPSATPLPTATPPATRTPLPTLTPDQTVTPTPFPCEAEGGTIIAFDDAFSEIAGENLRYRVYIPPCYQETGKRYPYVILLHGQAATEVQWDRIGLDEVLDEGILSGALAPMIAVMPYTGSIANTDPFPPAASYEAVILDELVPAVERDFCTWSQAEYRGIGGISRGGFWSFSIAMRNPDIFGRAGAHSAVFTAGNAPAESNPLDMAWNSSLLADPGLRLYMDNAANDPAGRGQETLSSRLSSRSIPHTYVIHPVGDHSEDYWQAHVPEYLAFYTADWPRNIADLPDCSAPSP